MDKSLLLYLLVASLAPHCISSINVLRDLGDDTIILDLSYQFIHLNLQKARQLNDSGIDSAQRNCSQKFLEFWNDLNNKTREIYLDSFGKVSAGILTGNNVFLGYYDQCIDIGDTDYCRFPFDVTLITSTTEPSNASVTIPLEFGMCFPSSCDAKDFYSLFSNYDILYTKSFTADVTRMIYTINVKAPSEYREPVCPLRELKWTSSSIIVLTICVLLIALVIMGTMVDVSLWFVDDILPKLYISELDPSEQTTSPPCEVNHSINEDKPLVNGLIVKASRQHVAETRYMEFVKNLILSFSLYKTIPAIMATHQPASAITSINGIRVLSMLWIILGHTYAMQQQFSTLANNVKLIEAVPKRFLFQIVDNYHIAVDSFFVLSGLLLSYSSIKGLERRQGKFPFISFYVHRLLRLSPGYYFVIFLYFKVLPHVGSGPVWLLANFDDCDKYWWANILYINNFYPAIYFESCYVVTWYMPALMQFFIISPIFLLLLYHFWKIGLTTIGGTALASIAISGTIAGIENYNANTLQNTMVTARSSFSNIYDKPYCRINAYLIGIVLGFVLYKNWRVKWNLWMRICFYSVLWIIAVSCCLVIVFGLYNTWNGHPFSKAENVLYYMFDHNTFSIGIALMIYACHNGFGGVINKFLSWSFWIPLSHLTFMAYLCHIIVLSLMYGTMRFRFIYTDWLLIILFAAAVMLSYSLALVLVVTVEYPIANVENAVYKFIGIKRRN